MLVFFALVEGIEFLVGEVNSGVVVEELASLVVGSFVEQFGKPGSGALNCCELTEEYFRSLLICMTKTLQPNTQATIAVVGHDNDGGISVTASEV